MKALKLLIGFFLTLSVFSAYAEDDEVEKAVVGDWTTTQIVKESVFTSLLLIDAKQTLASGTVLVDQPQPQPTKYPNNPNAPTTPVQYKYYEKNPFLGSHPSDRDIKKYFMSCIALQALVANVLPNPYRDDFLNAGIVLEVAVIADNYHVGVRFKF